MALPANYRHMMTSTLHSPSSQRSRASGGLNSKEANVSPFSPSIANPNFSPQRVGTKPTQASQAVLLKPPKGPEKPLMPYMRYSKSVWDKVKQQNQHLKLWEIGRIIGSMWRDLPEPEKQTFMQEYDLEKIEYERAVKEYHSSPSYQAYLNAKNKAAEEQVSHLTDTKPVTATVSKGLDRRIEIQPAEDEEDQDDQLSVKQVAHTRYLRNHRLINEIFSDTIVPDVRTVVTAPRMQLLKRQVHNLTMHQKKLEGELQQIEEKFEAKKRKFEESTETYNEELKKLCEKKVDDTIFQEMLKRQTELLQKEREEHQRQQQQEEEKKLREEEQQQAVPEIEKEEEQDNAENQQTSPNAVAENAPGSPLSAPVSDKTVNATAGDSGPVAMETESVSEHSVADTIVSTDQPPIGKNEQVSPDNSEKISSGNSEQLVSGNTEQIQSGNSQQLVSGNSDIQQPCSSTVASENIAAPGFEPSNDKDSTSGAVETMDTMAGNPVQSSESAESTTATSAEAEISNTNNVDSSIAMETDQTEPSSTVPNFPPNSDQKQCENTPQDAASNIIDIPEVSSNISPQQQQQCDTEKEEVKQERVPNQPDSTSVGVSVSDEEQQQQQIGENVGENSAKLSDNVASSTETDTALRTAEIDTANKIADNEQPVESTTSSGCGELSTGGGNGEPMDNATPSEVVDTVSSEQPTRPITDDVNMAE